MICMFIYGFWSNKLYVVNTDNIFVEKLHVRQCIALSIPHLKFSVVMKIKHIFFSRCKILSRSGGINSMPFVGLTGLYILAFSARQACMT